MPVKGMHPAESAFFAIMSEAEMSFTTESSGYEKTILSDLQGAWTLLRESVVDTGGFEGMDRVLSTSTRQ